MTAQPIPPPDPASTVHTALDEASLARLRALDPDGRLNVMARVFQTYEASLITALEQAARARDSADAPALGAVAHKLKSSSASVGALEPKP